MVSGRDRDLVFSTDGDSLCPACRHPRPECVCGQPSEVPGGDGVVRVSRQTKGRRGKAVTVITGAPLSASELANLARDLKRSCGCGGTVKNGAVELQGDRRDQVVPLLERRGWLVKKAGG